MLAHATEGLIEVLFACISGKCHCCMSGDQFACEQTARTAIDDWRAATARANEDARHIRCPHGWRSDGTCPEC